MKIVFFLKTAGILSTGVNGEDSNWRSLYCRVLCSIFWLFSLRQFALIFIKDLYIQVLLGDLTGYLNAHRMYYLLPSLFLSMQADLGCMLFMTNESKLNWLVPFPPKEPPPMLSNQIPMQHTVHNVRINISIIIALCSAFGSTAIVSYGTFTTAYENFSEETFRLWVPW